MLYVCDDGNAPIEIEASSAEEAAREYVEDGDWGNSTKTIWVSVNVTPVVNGRLLDEDDETYKIDLDPEEPDCPYGDHVWDAPIDIVGGIKENPGVWGKGGGVVIYEACIYCGCGKVIDTWDQDPCTGEQGLTSLNYVEEMYTDALENYWEKNWEMYAVVDEDSTITDVSSWRTDEEAQEWFRAEGFSGTLVAVDGRLGVGDTVYVDEDGVATEA